MKGLVLCAGLGERLRPLTERLPKPLVPVAGRPCVERILEWFAAHGITEVAINTHWLPEALHDHLGDGGAWGVRLSWQHEPALLDGMGTLKSFDWFLGDETAVVVNGDIVFDFGLSPILATHQRLGAALTLATTAQVGPMVHPVAWDDSGRLRAIRRTGLDDPRGRWLGVFTGVHVVESVIWQRWIPPGCRYHLTCELVPDLLHHDVCVAAHLVDGLWLDIGSLASLARAEALLAARRG